MHKFITALTLGLILTGSTAFASPAAEFEKGSINLEFGSTLNSKVTGKGHISAEVKGKSGFKAAMTAGLNDRLALQYKHGLFKSEDSTIMGITTYAQAKLWDINLLYKAHPNLTLVTGYEHTDISYGMAVSEAGKSAMHVGFTGTHKLNEKSTLFTTLIEGKDVSLKEIGISYKLPKATTLNVSYAKRQVKNVDLKVPALGINGKEDYDMTGITFVFNRKL